MWTKYASMCRQQGKMSMSRRVLCNLLKLPPNSPLDSVRAPLDKPLLALAVCKQNWADGFRRAAYTTVKSLASAMHTLLERPGSGGGGGGGGGGVGGVDAAATSAQLEPMLRLTAKCYLKLGDWNVELQQTMPIAANAAAARMRHASRHPHAQRFAAQFYIV